MSTADFTRAEGYREGYGDAAADIYDECAAYVRAWLADPENSPADIAAAFAQRARIERTTPR